jgi:hypothetical protein
MNTWLSPSLRPPERRGGTRAFLAQNHLAQDHRAQNNLAKNIPRKTMPGKASILDEGKDRRR